MSTPASTFTAGRVVIAAPSTAPCPPGVTGLDDTTCGAIISGEAADLTDKLYGPGAPATLVERTMLPQPVQTLLNDCEGSSTCQLVSYDFDKTSGERRDTRSHLISTATTTAHNAGVFVKDGVAKPPLFKTIPGYNFDGMFSFDPTKHAPLAAATSVIDERYCARACDDNPACGGFNYEPLSVNNCTLFRKGVDLKNSVYKDGRVAFIREDIDKLAKGSDPPGTNLAGTGEWCGLQNLTQCNADISDVITNNPEILSFTTSDLASCSACPAKTVARLDATRWAVTNEIDTTTIATTSADTITKLQYTTQSTPTPSTVLTPGSFYKITPYLPGMSFPAQTFLYMKRIKKFEVYVQNRFWTMSGISYNIPLGTYLTAEFLVALNDAGAPGTFSFDGSKFTWTGPYAVIDIAGTLQLAGFVDGQEPAADQIDSATGQATMSGWPVSFDNVSGGFFTHGKYTQQVRVDNGGICNEIGNTYNMGVHKSDQLPDVDGRATRIFGALGADFTNMSVEYSPVALEPIPVDYVVNGFLLRNPTNGRYTPVSNWQRTVWNEPVLRENSRNYGAYQSNDQPARCSVVPTDPSYGRMDSDKIVTEWEPEDFYAGCSRENGKSLPSKYTPQYNGFVFIITPATYADFYNEATASVPDQPMLIKRPGEPVPYIFNPGTDEFRVLRFPSQSSFDTHLAANPSWGKYYSPYKSVGKYRYLTLGEAEDCGPPAVGGPGGSYTFEEAITDPWPALTVYDENFWNTVPYDARVEISDPTYGCADPDDPGAYIGGEYQKTVGKVTFCQLCPAGTYSPASDKFATSCTPCAQGTYCHTGSGAEQQCAAGYYCPTPALQDECPAGSYCPAGVSAHIPCVAGDYCPAKSIAKQDCPAGSYCPTPAQKIQCPAGSYCTLRVTAHTPCVDTSVPPRVTAAGTPIAYYCPPGTRTLNECPAGYSCAGNSVATPAPPGFYCPTGSSVCIQCPTNKTYVPLSLTNVIGISQLTQVQVLNQIFTQGSTCYTCPIVDGVQTTANDARTACNCPVDSRNLKWRSWTNECLPNCPKGQASNAAKTGCEACGDNTYTSERGLAKCIPCAKNVPGAPAVHNADKSGCVCNGTVSNGSYEWNSTWNRCRLVCNAATHVAHAFTCYAKSVAATPRTLLRPDPVANYECPNGSQNKGGQFSSTTICTRPSNKDPVTKNGCTTPGCFCNYSCPANWSNNGTLPFKSQYCTSITRSCYRKSIITSHNCPECWKPKYFSGGVCPPGYRSTPGTSDCSLPPTSVKDETSLGIDTTVVGVMCEWNGYDDTRCGVCPGFPYRGYTGPTLDSGRTGPVRMTCTMNSAPVSNDPWGADGASPMTDPVTGNILMPSLVSLTLASVQGPPPGDPRIPCLRGSYLATPIGSLTTIGSDGAVSGVTSPIIPGEALPGSCLPCPDGTYCDAGYAAPYTCPVGYYCPNSSTIFECTAGQICPAGQTKWTKCEAGYFCSTTNTSEVCPAGFFCTEGVTEPTRCNTGEYCGPGSTRNDTCPAGSYCATPSEIAQCPAGSYCPAGTSVPRVCEVGNYCPAGSKVATPCTLGNYCDVGSSVQTPCDAGYYCPGPATRTACPAGTYNPTPGQSLSSACLECPAGTTCPYDGANTFSSRPNITPIRCAVGYYCPAGSATYNPCPDGSYCPTSSQRIQCVGGAGCPVGTISPGVWVPNQQITTTGAQSCRAACARGTGLPQQWNGAICVGTFTPGTTCETIDSLPKACNCQQALGFGWIV